MNMDGRRVFMLSRTKLSEMTPDIGFKPKEGATPEGIAYFYTERGGVYWYRCEVIKYHKNLVWIQNLETGSTPLKTMSSVLFKSVKSLTVSKDDLEESLKGGDTWLPF